MHDLIDRLRAAARSKADATQMLADMRSADYHARGDLTACYRGIKAEQTAEWQAADEIERLRRDVNTICNVALSIGASITDPVARQAFRNIQGALGIDEQKTNLTPKN